MKNKFIITGALALSLVTGGLTAFAATDTTVNTLPVSNVSDVVVQPTVKKVMHTAVVKKTIKKVAKVTAKKMINKKKVAKTTTAPASVAPTTPATN